MEEKAFIFSIYLIHTYFKMPCSKVFLHTTQLVANDTGRELEHTPPRRNTQSLLLGLFTRVVGLDDLLPPSPSMWATDLPYCLLILTYHDGDGWPWYTGIIVKLLIIACRMRVRV